MCRELSLSFCELIFQDLRLRCSVRRPPKFSVSYFTYTTATAYRRGSARLAFRFRALGRPPRAPVRRVPVAGPGQVAPTLALPRGSALRHGTALAHPRHRSPTPAEPISSKRQLQGLHSRSAAPRTWRHRRSNVPPRVHARESPGLTLRPATPSARRCGVGVKAGAGVLKRWAHGLRWCGRAVPRAVPFRV